MSTGVILAAAGGAGFCVSLAVTFIFSIRMKRQKEKMERYIKENY